MSVLSRLIRIHFDQCHDRNESGFLAHTGDGSIGVFFYVGFVLFFRYPSMAGISVFLFVYFFVATSVDGGACVLKWLSS